MRVTMFVVGSSLLALACRAKEPAEVIRPATLADDEPVEPPDDGASEGVGSTTLRLEEGKAGKPDPRRSREEAIEAARGAGILGTADFSSGFDDASIYGPAGSGTGVVGTGRFGGRGSRARAARVAPAQLDGVKAGEWDDNANYRDYTKWLRETPRGIARLDTSGRQFVVVRDKGGKPVPNCAVTIEGTQGKTTLVTSTAGRVLVFPKAYQLGTPRTATTACGGTPIVAPLGDQLDTVTQISLPTQRALPARRVVDLAFVLDTTGSMSEEIDAVKATITAVANQLSSDQVAVRIGLVEYKDRTDEQVTRVFPFSSDLGAFSRKVATLAAAGGGDAPEDMHAGLTAALDRLAWRGDAAARMMFVIADAPPHLDYQGPDYAASAVRAAKAGVRVYTVAASGMDTVGQIVMRQMSQLTGATNLFVLRGGAGPQSVGGGDPKSSCGGTQEQYATGNLHALVIAKVERELAALDQDPLQIAGIGKDESSKPCNQRLAVK